MDVLTNASFDLTIMKEPRGLLRVIQFVLSILAFATVCSSAAATVNVSCEKNFGDSTTVKITYSYPFNMKSYTVDQPFCSKKQSPGTPFEDLTSFASASQFFCFMGVMSFLLCIAYCIGYTFYGSLFTNDSRAATIDFIFSIVWTVLWFIGSTAWADNLSTMTAYLNPSFIIEGAFNSTSYCGALHVKDCSEGDSGNTATLVISVLFGYLNMLVWGAGLWFLFKETRWHKEPQEDTANFDQPAAAAGKEGTYQAPDNSGSTIY